MQFDLLLGCFASMCHSVAPWPCIPCPASSLQPTRHLFAKPTPIAYQATCLPDNFDSSIFLQCAKPHCLEHFEEARRSCRASLEKHKRRRQQPGQRQAAAAAAAAASGHDGVSDGQQVSEQAQRRAQTRLRSAQASQQAQQEAQQAEWGDKRGPGTKRARRAAASGVAAASAAAADAGDESNEGGAQDGISQGDGHGGVTQRSAPPASAPPQPLAPSPALNQQPLPAPAQPASALAGDGSAALVAGPAEAEPGAAIDPQPALHLGSNLQELQLTVATLLQRVAALEHALLAHSPGATAVLLPAPQLAAHQPQPQQDTWLQFVPGLPQPAVAPHQQRQPQPPQQQYLPAEAEQQLSQMVSVERTCTGRAAVSREPFSCSPYLKGIPPGVGSCFVLFADQVIAQLLSKPAQICSVLAALAACVQEPASPQSNLLATLQLVALELSALVAPAPQADPPTLQLMPAQGLLQQGGWSALPAAPPAPPQGSFGLPPLAGAISALAPVASGAAAAGANQAAVAALLPAGSSAVAAAAAPAAADPIVAALEQLLVGGLPGGDGGSEQHRALARLARMLHLLPGPR